MQKDVVKKGNEVKQDFPNFFLQNAAYLEFNFKLTNSDHLFDL